MSASGTNGGMLIYYATGEGGIPSQPMVGAATHRTVAQEKRLALSET